ncbi:MAG: histidinol-phosphate transaminase [Bacteroidales bacterium]|nr:histidinol-phosphate transaminase [Bacteroidales bacterium]
MNEDLEKLLRNNLKNRQPYASARDEFKLPAEIFLDANENPFETGMNRYPDPHQNKLKEKIAEVRGTQKENVFIGNGSDEVLDLLFRAFCEPRMDNVIIMPPTYGMYETLAEINDVECRKVPLNEDFSLSADKVLKVVDDRTKIIFLCSPNNPTGNTLAEKEVIRLMEETRALVVLDEAYIDFSSKEGFVKRLNKYSRLVIIQTLSKAWGLAGLRLGLGFASKEIVLILDGIKPPYNVNTYSQQKAMESLSDPAVTAKKIAVIQGEKEKMRKALEQLPGVTRVFPSDTNFLLIEIKNATKIYETLINKGIVLRNRSGMLYCKECLRITIGTPEENARLMDELRNLEL